MLFRSRQAGVYRTEKRIESATLLDESESAVDVASLDDRPDTVRNFSQTEQRTVPRRLTEFGVIAVLLVLVLEVAYLRRRGDL